MSDPANNLSFKVIQDGESCHGGHHQWSLPNGDTPGDWHEINGKPNLCYTGFHLTHNPVHWFEPGCAVYIAEYAGLVSGPQSGGSDPTKFAVQRCRLLRPATPAELADLGIYLDGVHNARKSGLSLACGSSQVKAYDSSQVKAYGSSQVKAYDSSQVKAYGSSQVTAKDRTTTLKHSLHAAVSLIGCAVAIDWTAERAELIRSAE